MHPKTLRRTFWRRRLPIFHTPSARPSRGARHVKSSIIQAIGPVCLALVTTAAVSAHGRDTAASTSTPSATHTDACLDCPTGTPRGFPARARPERLQADRGRLRDHLSSGTASMDTRCTCSTTRHSRRPVIRSFLERVRASQPHYLGAMGFKKGSSARRREHNWQRSHDPDHHGYLTHLRVPPSCRGRRMDGQSGDDPAPNSCLLRTDQDRQTTPIRDATRAALELSHHLRAQCSHVDDRRGANGQQRRRRVGGIAKCVQHRRPGDRWAGTPSGFPARAWPERVQPASVPRPGHLRVARGRWTRDICVLPRGTPEGRLYARSWSEPSTDAARDRRGGLQERLIAGRRAHLW